MGQTETQPIAVGDRVTAVFHDKDRTGEVVAVGSDLIQVRCDDDGVERGASTWQCVRINKEEAK